MDPTQLEVSVRRLNENLGAALLLLRNRSGKRQADIASVTGMSTSQISRYENGRELPNLVTLVKYLFAVDADLRDVAAVLEDEPPRPSISDVVQMLREGTADAVFGKAIKDLVVAAMASQRTE